MSSKRKNDYAPHIMPDMAPPCHAEGCVERGCYKAPLSRQELHDYRWFCLEHIREHNERWDYFAGLEREEIEFFMKDAVHGHRPTWSREERLKHLDWELQDALYEFLHMGAKAQATPPVPHRLRQALAALDLDYPYTKEQLKTQYRALVKKHHPDRNAGNKQSEERFKQIAVAYQDLLEHSQNEARA